MKLITGPYSEHVRRWPAAGRHILAQYDAETVVVYQAYRPAIGGFAVRHGYFGGEFSLDRMSWVKPNFLWMMYRSGWGAKEGQEVVLAIWLKRNGFDSILSQAVHSTYDKGLYVSEREWKEAIKSSDVRLQWDPDHDPAGRKVERKAIQLGLRGQALAKYAREWTVEIEDISEFVREQRQYATLGAWDRLVTPREEPYVFEDQALTAKLRLAQRY